VRLSRRLERLLDADVELMAAGEGEPRAAARAQGLRLLELLEAEQLAEEAACLAFAAGRRCDLYVV
jgi:hypothetical protein